MNENCRLSAELLHGNYVDSMGKEEKPKKHWIWISAAAVLLLLIGWIVWGNLTVQTTVYRLSDANLPQEFEGFRIAQISDLHNAEFGKNNQRSLDILEKQKPDIIVITGDFVDSNHTDLDVSVSFAEQAVKLAPCYYVTGNHEARSSVPYQELEQRLRACGVTVLRNETARIVRNGEAVQLIGVDDPNFQGSDSSLFHLADGILAEEIRRAHPKAGYQILLSHRPETFDTYVDSGVNLAFCGHAHGGQVRLPFLGGLIAPNQGFFPKYDGGVYQRGKTTMVVSRGIGNSVIPIRINNRPEIVIAELHQK